MASDLSDGQFSSLTPADPRLRRWTRLRLLVALAAVAIGLVWLQSLNEALRASSAPGCPSGTPVDIQRGPAAPDEALIAPIITGWQIYSARIASTTVEGQDPASASTAACRAVKPGTVDTPRVSNAFDVAHQAIRVDSLVFAPAYGVALWAILRTLANAQFDRNRHPLLAQVRRVVVRTGDPGRVGQVVRLRSRWWWLVLLGGAIVFDELENAVLARSIDTWRATLDAGRALRVDVTWLEVFGWAKWLCLAAPMGMALVIAVRALVDGLAVIRQTIRFVWVQLVAAVAFVVVCNVAQGADVIRRLSFWQWGVTLATLSLFAVVVGLTAGGLLRAMEPWPQPSVPDSGSAARPGWTVAARPGLTIAAVGAAVIAVAALTDRPGLGRLGMILVPLGVVSAVLDLSARSSSSTLAKRADAALGSDLPSPADIGVAVERRAKVGACLAGLILAGFGLATIKASAGDLAVLRHGRMTIGLRLTIGVLLALAAGPAVLVLRATLMRGDRWRQQRRRVVVLLATSALIAVCGTLLKMHDTALDVAAAFGTLNVVAVFLASFCLLGSLASQASRFVASTRDGAKIALPSALRGLGVQAGAAPFLVLAVAWAAASTSANYSEYYAARVTDVGVPHQLLSPTAAVRAWNEQQPAAQRSATMVAASGGGIRAAYWTALVLTCLTERDAEGADPCGRPAPVERVVQRRRSLLAMSGVSGGSLGLAEYVAMIGPQWEPGATITPLDLDWVRQALGKDYLSPTLATYLFHDALNSLVRPQVGRDRADTLEWAWERAAPPESLIDEHFLAHQTTGRQPFLMLNGMSVGTGCRVLVSALVTQRQAAPEQCARSLPTNGVDAATSTIDLGQLCGTCDFNYSTAALLSARFPFVTPAGRVDVKHPGDAGKVNSIDVVDGGYRENSGASTLVELDDEFRSAFAGLEQTCVGRVFLQIDNGYSNGEVEASGDINLNQLLAPLTAATGVATGVERAARQASIATFPRWFRVSTSTHPGSSAPLGWVLSNEAQDDLRNQLQGNATIIAAVRQAIDAPRCDSEA